MPYEGKTGPDTGESFSAQLSNLEHRFQRRVDQESHVNFVLSAELDRAFTRCRELAAAESREEFDAEIQRQEDSLKRVLLARTAGGVAPGRRPS